MSSTRKIGRSNLVISNFFTVRNPVAVILLQDVQISQLQEAALSHSVAIVGSLNTENLGVEHVVKKHYCQSIHKEYCHLGQRQQGPFSR